MTRKDISNAAAILGRKGGSKSSEAKRLAAKANAKKRWSHFIWAAIAQFDGKDAGFVCYGRTKDECYTKARKQTTMTFAVRRETADDEHIAKLEALGKL